MTRIPESDRDIIEKALYLPMLIVVLERDRLIFEKAAFKLKQPYVDLVEDTLKQVQRDLKKAKDYLRKNKIKIQEIERDDAFTTYAFIYKGYEEHHNYFNMRIRNKVNELLNKYLRSKK